MEPATARPAHNHATARTFHRDQNQECVENSGNRYAGGIEDGKQENPGRPPSHEGVGQMAKQSQF